MDSRKDLWKFIRTICRICVYVGIPSFFYFFGYRINGSWKIQNDTLPFDNPFLYINIGAVVIGILVLGLSLQIEKNDYRLNGKIVIKAFGRLALLVGFIAIIRIFLY